MRSGNALVEALFRTQPWLNHCRPLDRELEIARRLGLGWDDSVPASARNYLAHLVRATHPAGGGSAAATGADACASVNMLHRSLMAASTGRHRWCYVRMHQPLEYLPGMLAAEDLHCIFILRDARDVVRSRVYRGDDDTDSYALQWRRFARLAHENAHHPRARVLQFEKLLEDPERCAQQLGEWLGEEVHFPIGSPDIRWPNHSSFGELNPGFQLSAAHRWESSPDEALVRYVGHACRRELALWGYPTSLQLPAPRERLRFAARLGMSQVIARARRGRDRLRRRFFPPLVE